MCRCGSFGIVDHMDGESNPDDPARLWRGLAIWPMIAGGLSVLIAVVLRPEEVGPVFTVLGSVIIVSGFVAVVVGCFGVARTSRHKLERRLFAIAGGVLVTVAVIAPLLILGLAFAMCASSFAGC